MTRYYHHKLLTWISVFVVFMFATPAAVLGADEHSSDGTPNEDTVNASKGEPSTDEEEAGSAPGENTSEEKSSPESKTPASSPKADDTLGNDTTKSSLIPPSVVEYVEAQYPPEAFAQGIEAAVLTEVDIDETGAVVEVRIVEPAGQGFDEAADAAIRRFKFTPATLDGVPIPSRITYRYNFFIKEDEPKEVVEDTSAPATAHLLGRVRTMENAPIPEAVVRIVAKGKTDQEKESEAQDLPVFETVTDENGQFEFTALLPGSYLIEIIAAGYTPFESEEQLEAGEIRELLYRLAVETAEYEVVVRSKRPAREVTRRVVTQKEITKIPGTGGDALRAVQNMPGMARAPLAGGEILIRGSAPSDSVYFLDTLSIPMLYHFGGLTSIINSDLLESIDYYPGNFSVRFGRATGGAIDVKTRAPKQDRFHAYIDADVWDVGVLAEGPIGKKWSVAGAMRRSYVDSFMEAANLMGDEIKLTVAPRYYDFQLIADYHPSKDNNLRLSFFGSDDKWIMVWDDASDPFWGTGLDTHLMTYQGQADWKLRINDKFSNRLSAGFSYMGGNYNEGNMKQDWDIYPLLIREELTYDPGKYFRLRIGTDTELRWAKVKMKVPSDPGIEGELGYANDPWMTFEGNRFIAEPALYAEFELVALPRTQIIYGLRGDYHSGINEWGVDPRATIRYELFPVTTLKAGFGLFHQPPSLMNGLGDEEYGNPDLELTQAVHYSAGVEQNIGENVEFSLEGFYKSLNRVIRSSDEMVERDGELVPERYNNDATGRVYGMEVQLKHNPTSRFFGWISYTLMRSERFDEPGAPARLFDYDQTHILTAVGNVSLGWGIDIGLRFRLVSGNPYTPIEGSHYDAHHDEYVPVYGKIASKRMPLFHQLDLRIDKRWQWKYLAATLYLDVQNAYNRKNPEGYAYSYDYKQKGVVQGLPVLPSLGLKLEY